MRVNRRGLLTGGAAGAALFLMSLTASPAWALTADQAKAHVQETIDELLTLLRAPGKLMDKTPQLQEIMKKRANLPQIARFAAGRVWRQMTPDQQKRYVDVFAKSVAMTYAERFNTYAGGNSSTAEPKIQIGRVINAGKKGFLIETPVNLGGSQPIDVSWLVSDRGGRVDIVDIVIEGVSMAATLREQIAAMFQRNGGDVDALITALASGKQPANVGK